MKQFLLHCADFSIQRETLFDKLTELNIDVLTRNDDDYIVKTLLLGQQDFDNDFDFIIATERLNCYLFSFFFFSFLWKSLGIQVYNGRKYPWLLFCVCSFLSFVFILVFVNLRYIGFSTLFQTMIYLMLEYQVNLRLCSICKRVIKWI